MSLSAVQKLWESWCLVLNPNYAQKWRHLGVKDVSFNSVSWIELARNEVWWLVFVFTVSDLQVLILNNCYFIKIDVLMFSTVYECTNTAGLLFSCSERTWSVRWNYQIQNHCHRMSTGWSQISGSKSGNGACRYLWTQTLCLNPLSLWTSALAAGHNTMSLSCE